MFQKPWKNRLQHPFGYVIAGVVAAALSITVYAAMQYYYQSRESSNRSILDNAASAEVKPNGDAGLQQLKKTSESFRLLAKQLGPTVVNIKSTKGAESPRPSRGIKRRRGGEENQESPFPRDPFFEFFEKFGQPFPFNQPEVPQQSLGSGIIIDKKGYIVTNNHVVDEASKIVVRVFGDKPTELKAKVVGTDPRTDLAVLKVEPTTELVAAEWGDSDAVEVGDWAIAIGSPFDLGNSVTVGIVSAKGRSARLTGSDYGELIQTDAAINPGNSGGPLCTLDGKVMGVNTAIYTRSGGYMGIGFAIPSSLAKEVVGKLISDGKIVRGWLGVLIQPLDEELAKELGISDGVAIHEVMEDGPAAASGLGAGDVVIEVDGKPVRDVTQLQRIIAGFKPGQNVKIKVVSYGDKKTRTVSVKIGVLPEQEREARMGREDEVPDEIGVLVSKGKSRGDGVIIDFVQPGSLADQAGLEVGDVIVSINRKSIDSVSTYRKAIGSGKKIRVMIKRKNPGARGVKKPPERTLFFDLTLP